jgi:hypothetical protein
VSLTKRRINPGQDIKAGLANGPLRRLECVSLEGIRLERRECHTCWRIRLKRITLERVGLKRPNNSAANGSCLEGIALERIRLKSVPRR